jgi:magnesium transporter
MTGPIDSADDDDAGGLMVDELREAWAALSPAERSEGFHLLAMEDREEFFFRAAADEQAELMMILPEREARAWTRALAPDDAADLVQQTSRERRPHIMALLDEATRKEVTALLAYAEDHAGGLMNPRYARVRPEMSVDEAIAYLRKQARDSLEATYYVYVIDADNTLLGVTSFRTLFMKDPRLTLREFMATDLITIPEQMDQEQVSSLFREHDLLALPVVDEAHHMKGVVTVDDIVDVVDEEATEDAHKFGGMEALDQPYLAERFSSMIQKRGGWLTLLFLGEMLTASAMTHFEEDIARAVVLALFVPLIISSGGNSGSQASTLVIRAMALGEVRAQDWWRVARRELASGAVLGGGLGAIGFLRICVWEWVFGAYGPHYVGLAFTVAISLVGVVLFGTMAGSMLPFVLRKAKLDPASASAPFVATLVDVSGLVIYFSVATLLLGGKLL